LYLINPTIDDIKSALESWDWIDFSGLTPIAVSCFGDIFFDSESAIYFLDTLEGRLKEICKTRTELQALLNTTEGQDEFLLGGLVDAIRARGVELKEGECYDFKVSPVLGGPIEVENVWKMNFEVSLNIAGQIHRQVKDLPPGTKITEVRLADS
jgi:hypothetical protein